MNPIRLFESIRVALAVGAGLTGAGIAGADVLVVDAGGAPFQTIQAAVNAAQDGDTILVKPGAYAGFVVDGKALAIVADPEGSAEIESAILFQNLAAGKQASFSGFRFRTATFGGLVAQQMQGSLRLVALEALTPPCSSRAAGPWPTRWCSLTA